MAYKMFNLPIPPPEDRAQPDINAINEVRQELLGNGQSMGPELDNLKIEKTYSPPETPADSNVTSPSSEHKY